jgi:hypothetical protein
LVATAAHLTDHVLPDLPVQQWVLAVPKRLRYFLHRDADLQGAAGAIIFHAASELDAKAIADVQTWVRQRPLRYCARPPFALDRLRELDREHLIYEHPKPGPGGSGPRLLTPLELLDRLAVLVPPPRIHRHRYFGARAHDRLLEISAAASNVWTWPVV